MRKLVDRRMTLKIGLKRPMFFTEMTGYSCFAEIQNLSSDPSLNFIFKVQSHCCSFSSSSCRISRFSVLEENSVKGFLTQSYVFHDKEGKYLSSFSDSDPK